MNLSWLCLKARQKKIITDDAERDEVLLELRRTAEGFGTTSIPSLVRAIGVASNEIEQDRDADKVNILTMHRAKGLTAEAVILAATEDEYIPGRAEGEGIEDERRLLYVSLTRAKHHLYVTYCDKRVGQQRHTGRTSGDVARTLTQFLRDSPRPSRDGRTFVANLNSERGE